MVNFPLIHTAGDRRGPSLMAQRSPALRVLPFCLLPVWMAEGSGTHALYNGREGLLGPGQTCHQRVPAEA